MLAEYITGDLFQTAYKDVFRGDDRWQGLKVPEGETFTWDDKSTYVKNPPYFENMPKTPAPVGRYFRARACCATSATA